MAAILSIAGWAVGGLGAQRILQRFMALQRDDQVAKSRRMSVAWISCVFLLAVLLGVVARPALADIGLLGQATDPERVYLVMSEVFFHPVVTGVLLTAGDRSGDEHCGLPASTGVSGCRGRPALYQRRHLSGVGQRARMVRARAADPDRDCVGAGVHLLSRLDLQLGQLRLGRYGRGFRDP